MGFSSRLRFGLAVLPTERVPVLGPASSRTAGTAVETGDSSRRSSEDDLLLLRLPLDSGTRPCSIGTRVES